MDARGLLLLVLVLLSFTGCAMRTADLVRANDDLLARTDEVPEADRLGVDPLVPGDAQLVHVVHAGETLSEIALRYGVRVSAICQLNRILDPHRIEIGQRLRLPQDAVLASRSPLASKPSSEPRRAQVLLAEAEESYLEARFERALEHAQEAEALLEGEASGNELRARAAFVAGSALAGLGEEERASEQFARVHELDSRFEPPSGWLSPRLGSLYGSASAR
jgi:murein DD-endopeptidase MepM/ murein hydrolase activator NlpD